jgi:phosphopantothenoylcysteine decarboxylase / phosphopantothenate---cysteine ligase
MNDAMWDHPATQRQRCPPRGAGVPARRPRGGPLAFGEGSGPGRMAEPAVLIQHIGRALEGETRFGGRRVVVTAGPTREAVDPVRFLSNRSSGRMGFALAAAAWRRGADVDLVVGRRQMAPPPGPRIHRGGDGRADEGAVQRLLADADLLVMAAAPADFRPATLPTRRSRRSRAPSPRAGARAGHPEGDQGDRRPGADRGGFALETEAGEASAGAKLESKGMDLVVLNQTGPTSGFDTETNEVTLLERGGESETFPTCPRTRWRSASWTGWSGGCRSRTSSGGGSGSPRRRASGAPGAGRPMSSSWRG